MRDRVKLTKRRKIDSNVKSQGGNKVIKQRYKYTNGFLLIDGGWIFGQKQDSRNPQDKIVYKCRRMMTKVHPKWPKYIYLIKANRYRYTYFIYKRLIVGGGEEWRKKEEHAHLLFR